MIKFGCVLETAGDGLWSEVAKKVQLTGIDVSYINEEQDFGELCVYFDKSWDIRKDGLIYTDSQFLDQLCGELLAAGLNSIDVEYSEQGMQGDDYVSFDVGPAFLNSFKEIAIERYIEVYESMDY